jgi:hypothetical protein
VLELSGFYFTQGRSKFSDHAPGFVEPTAKVYVTVLLGQSSQPVPAQLDTGAAWSVLPPHVAREAGVPPDSDRPVLMSTRLGIKRGYLARASLVFVAEQGESLYTEGTFFICPDWPEGQVFLGYSGLLDSIRFALDPQANNFFFGTS